MNAAEARQKITSVNPNIHNDSAFGSSDIISTQPIFTEALTFNFCRFRIERIIFSEDEVIIWEKSFHEQRGKISFT